MSEQLGFGFAAGYEPPRKAEQKHREPAQQAVQPQTTSQEALADVVIKISKCHKRFVDALRKLGVPSTAAEIAKLAHEMDDSSSPETYRKRAAECVRAGLVVDGEPRICTITSKRATTYRMKP